MGKSAKCSYCHYDFPMSSERCPHCAQPGLFPNVRAAEDLLESAALEKRYEAAMQDTGSRGCGGKLQDFENVVSSSSHAVIARSLLEVDRLASSERELYATYYQLIQGGVRLPTGGRWDIIRTLTDDALFSGYKQHVRFAALSLQGFGLSNYGECSIVLEDRMIAHRASVFEENSVIFMERHGVTISESDNLPKGYRTDWQGRGKIAAVKVANEIHAKTQSSDYPRLLLEEGRTSADDKFIEVHIWGPMTIRTFNNIFVERPKRKASRLILNALSVKLKKYGVALEVRK